EYDPDRDLLYFDFSEDHPKVDRTVTISMGVHADFDRDGRLLGIEVLEASALIGKKIEFALPELVVSKPAV
ncbi:MAG: DUF2283 domain-containing protein, partial [Bacteroidota bacterium]